MNKHFRSARHHWTAGLWATSPISQILLQVSGVKPRQHIYEYLRMSWKRIRHEWGDGFRISYSGAELTSCRMRCTTWQHRNGAVSKCRLKLCNLSNSNCNALFLCRHFPDRSSLQICEIWLLYLLLLIIINRILFLAKALEKFSFTAPRPSVWEQRKAPHVMWD